MIDGLKKAWAVSRDHYHHNRKLLAIVLVLGLLAWPMSQFIPVMITSRMVTSAEEGMPYATLLAAAVWIVFIAMILVTLGLGQVLSTKLTALTNRRFRWTLLLRCVKAPFKHVTARFLVGDLTRRVMDDSSTAAAALVFFVQAILHVAFLACLVTYALFSCPAVLIVSVASIAVEYAIGHLYEKVAVPAVKRVREESSNLLGFVQEYADNVDVIVRYRALKRFQARFADVRRRLTDSDARVVRLDIFKHSASRFAEITFRIALFVIIRSMLDSATLSAGGMLSAFMVYSLMGMPISSIRHSLSRLPMTAVAAERVADILNLPSEKDGSGFASRTSGIVFDVSQASVCYRDRPVLDQVSLTILSGQKVAVVGPNGSGKTTLLRLLAGIVQPDEGEVFLFGHSLAELPTAARTRLVSYIPQQTMLFTDSIGQNIRYGWPESTEEEMLTASRKACLHSVVEQLECRYDTEIDQQRTVLSAGELQRVSIARGVVGHAPVLLADEPTANLDNETSQIVLRNVLDHAETVVYVTHRPELARLAETIVVMDRGRVEAVGSHEALVLGNRWYAEWIKRSDQPA